jgi:hypothetical protein
VQIYAFAMHMQALAIVANESVTVLSHLNLQGINSGSGLSGSTAWHGAFRFRQYLKGVKASDGEQPDNDLRELEFKKNQYGPRGDSIVLRYLVAFSCMKAVCPVPIRRCAGPGQRICSSTCCAVFLHNRNVSDKVNANNHPPTAFAREDDAKKYGVREA